MAFLNKKGNRPEDARPQDRNASVIPGAAEALTGALGGLKEEEAAAITKEQEVVLAQQAVQSNAVPEGKRKFILQEIKIDPHCTVRRRVELTPSMCTVRGCGFDAAKAVGYANGWKDAPLDQALPGGRTMKEAILGVLETHQLTGHALDLSHIVTEDELNAGKQWAGVPGAFLTNPKMAAA